MPKAKVKRQPVDDSAMRVVALAHAIETVRPLDAAVAGTAVVNTATAFLAFLKGDA